MSVLFRIVAALLIALPTFLVLVLVFALAGRRRTSLPSRPTSSLEAGSESAAGAHYAGRLSDDECGPDLNDNLEYILD